MKTLKNYLCAFSILFAVGNLKSADAATEDLTSSMVDCTNCLTLQRRINEIESHSGIRGMTDSGIFSAVSETELRLTATEKELRKVKARLEEQQKSHRTLEDQNQTLQAQNKILQESLAAETEAKRKLVEKVGALETSLACKDDKEQSELEALRAQCVRLHTDLDTLVLEKKKLEDINTEQAASILTLQDGNSFFIRQRDELRQQISDLETEIAGQKSLEQSVVAVQLRGPSLSAELAEAAAGSALPTFKDQAIQTDKDAEIAAARARIVELEAELATVRSQGQAVQVPAPVQPTRIVQSQVSCWKRYLMPAFAGAAMTYFLMRK